MDPCADTPRCERYDDQTAEGLARNGWAGSETAGSLADVGHQLQPAPTSSPPSIQGELAAEYTNRVSPALAGMSIALPAAAAELHPETTPGRCSHVGGRQQGDHPRLCGDGLNQQQPDRAEELVAPDFLDHAPLPGQAPGLEGAKRKWAMYLNAVPDLRVTIDDLVAEGDKVAVRRSYEGTGRSGLPGGRSDPLGLLRLDHQRPPSS